MWKKAASCDNRDKTVKFARSMAKIVLLSDTHNYLDDAVFSHLEGVRAIWHAGDIGELSITDRLGEFAPVRAVYGNVDGHKVREAWPEDDVFEIEGLKVYMTHIGGYPGRYSPHARAIIDREKPGLFISGHSHIVKAMRDPKRGLLHLNPGAVGIEGLHKVRTLMTFEVEGGKVTNLNLVELGKRGRLA